MIEYKVEGTLGDTYTVLCKLYNTEDPILIHHITAHTYWNKKIKDIYSLLPNITVNFNNTYLYAKALSSIPNYADTEFFPKFKFTNYLKKDGTYLVVQAHAGRDNDAMSRFLSKETIYNIIDKFHPVPVVLLGTIDRYKSVTNCINLVGKTSILEAMSVTAKSSGFVGPEGILAFVALSQKVKSIIFYPREDVINKRIKGLPWEEYVIDFIKMDGRVY